MENKIIGYVILGVVTAFAVLLGMLGYHLISDRIPKL